MYLILGSEIDPCCAQVSLELKTRGYEVHFMDGLFSEPQRFMWRFAGGGSLRKGNSRIGIRDQWEADSSDVKGVLVRDMGYRAMHDWSEKDGQYMSAEMMAALLGWLWSLPGIVVNRIPAWLFYRPRPSFLFWMPFLRDAGLRTFSRVIGNDVGRLRDWRVGHPEGTVFTPMLDNSHFQVQTDAEWNGVLRVANHTPIQLEEAHGEPLIACVVGESVVWEGDVPEHARAMEPALIRFAQAAGLSFVQIAVAEQSQEAGYAVVDVEPYANFARFGIKAQKLIVDALVDLLAGVRGNAHAHENMAIEMAAIGGGSAR
jgi:hypothetical protein